MQTSIFGKPLSDVTKQDVRDFCSQQIREGINLDYKRDLSSKTLLKTMAAFANTRGGFIIVGVDDVDDKPVLPIEGIDWRESLPLGITSMIIDNMYPYLSVDIHVCEPENGKTFVLIYVPESHEAPHWLLNRTELYVRRADRASHTQWERFATEGEWDFLRNKRERSIELRNQALQIVTEIFEAESRANKHNALGYPIYDSIKPTFYSGMLRTEIVPLFPRGIICDVLKVNAYLRTKRIQTLFPDEEYPQLDIQTKLFQDGVYKFEANNDGDALSMNLLTRLGVVATYDMVLRKQEQNPTHFIYFGEALASIEATLRYAGNLYNELAFTGSVMCKVSLDTVNNTGLLLTDQSRHKGLGRSSRNLRGHFAWQVEPSVTDLSSTDTRTIFLYEIMREFSRSFNFAGDSNMYVDEYLSKSGLYPKPV